jgi:hypothetical protein
MTEARPKRRPLPALFCLLALTLLSALVWWRVLNRDSGSNDKSDASCSQKTSTSQKVLPRPGAVTVFVLNSTNRAGLAKSTAATLGKRGFKVAGYGNDTGNPVITGVAEIRYSADEKDAATLLGFYVTGAKPVPLPATASQKLELSLGNRFKAVTTATGVAAAMKAANTTVAPSPSPGQTGSAATC